MKKSEFLISYFHFSLLIWIRLLKNDWKKSNNLIWELMQVLWLLLPMLPSSPRDNSMSNMVWYLKVENHQLRRKKIYSQLFFPMRFDYFDFFFPHISSFIFINFFRGLQESYPWIWSLFRLFQKSHSIIWCIYSFILHYYYSFLFLHSSFFLFHPFQIEYYSTFTLYFI